MRPPIVTTKTLTTPGRNIALTLALQPQPVTGLNLQPGADPVSAAACIPDIVGLFWLSDADGAFSTTEEVAYLLPLPDQAAGPVLAVAGLIGKSCGALADWKTGWTPASGSGGDPGAYEDGNRLVVWPKADTEPGVLTATASLGGRRYGPISLTVLRYECACYGSGGSVGASEFAFNSLVWNTGLAHESQTTAFGAPPISYTATITGTWPDGTTFEWDNNDDGIIGGIAMSVSEDTLVFTLDYDGGVQPAGTATITVTATSPLGSTQTLGPITFTVYPY